MYFGSVKFFRHLILTVVFGWIAVATVLAVFFGIKCHKLENEEKPPLTIEDHIAQMNAQGFTAEEIQNFLNRGSGGAVIASAPPPSAAQTPPADSSEPAVSQSEALLPPPSVNEPADAPETLPAVDPEPVAEIAEEQPENIGEQPQTAETQPAVTESKPAVTESKPVESKPAVTESRPAPTADISELYPDMKVSAPSNQKAPSAGTVVLTFEGAPSGNMSDILIILDRQNAPATFMLTGCEDEDQAEIVKRAKDMGCTLGVLAGEDKKYSSAADYLSDFNEIYSGVKEAGGSAPQLYRIPDSTEMSDSVRRDVMAELDSRGFTYCSFNALSDDRVKGMDWQQLYDTVTSRVFLNRMADKASVIQLHSGSGDTLTVYTAEDIILGLKEEGYSFSAYNNTMLVE